MTETETATYPAPVTVVDQPPAAREAGTPWTIWLPYLLLSLIDYSHLL